MDAATLAALVLAKVLGAATQPACDTYVVSMEIQRTTVRALGNANSTI